MWQVFFFHFHSFLIFYLLNDNYSFLGVFDDSRHHRTHGFFEFTNHLVHSFNFPILPFAINSFTVSCVIYYFLPLILEYMKDKNKRTGNKRNPKASGFDKECIKSLENSNQELRYSYQLFISTVQKCCLFSALSEGAMPFREVVTLWDYLDFNCQDTDSLG